MNNRVLLCKQNNWKNIQRQFFYKITMKFKFRRLSQIGLERYTTDGLGTQDARYDVLLPIYYFTIYRCLC
jgi:hypothetical protein